MILFSGEKILWYSSYILYLYIFYLRWMLMASSSSPRKNDNNASKSSENHVSLWKKMLQPGGHWEDKVNHLLSTIFLDQLLKLWKSLSILIIPLSQEEFLDVIYWTRQIVAIIIGITWGLLGFTGFFGISSFAVVNSAFVYIYSINFNEDQEDLLEFIKEGFMTAFSAFMVSVNRKVNSWVNSPLTFLSHLSLSLSGLLDRHVFCRFLRIGFDCRLKLIKVFTLYAWMIFQVWLRP